MGNITDKLLVLLLSFYFFFRGFLKTKSHVLIVAVHGSNLAFFLDVRRKHIVEIAVLDVLHGHVELVNWFEKAPSNPHGQQNAGKQQDQNDGYTHIYYYLGSKRRAQPGNNIQRAFLSRGKVEIDLSYKPS